MHDKSVYKKNIYIDENIRIQEDAVEKAKERYDKEVSKLKDMYAKREEEKRTTQGCGDK